MSCICQYIVGSSALSNGGQLPVGVSLPNPYEHEAAVANEGPCDASNEPVTDDTKIAGCVSELADCRAENWLLKKKLEEHEVTIQNLEHLMTTIVNKQHKVLSEMFQLRKRNHELQTECNLQREYHTMERNALIKELHNLKTLNNEHTYALSGEENEPNSSAEDQPETGTDVEKGNYAYYGEEDEDESKHGNEDEDSYEDGDDDERSAGSSARSTASFSHNSSMYSTFSESGESEESEDEQENDESESD